MAGLVGRCDGCCSLLAGYREIRGGGASLEIGRREGLSFQACVTVDPARPQPWRSRLVDADGRIVLPGQLPADDNLLDLAHLSYVHENTLGRNSMSWAESKPTVTPIPRGLRIARWVLNNPSPRYLTVPGGASHVDMWASYDYMVPGIFLLGTRTYPVGTAAGCDMQAPDPDAQPLTTTTTSQAVTPIDEQHTIYYYSGCLPRRLTSEEDSRQQLALFERAFAEDNAMIEAQQRVIAQTQQPRMLRIRADHALNRFRRLMDELMMAEGGVAAADPALVPLAAEG
jgi:phenylpropionate dioxygenase-like ring-hydroxylating dioxygenase large terminal subunit